MQNKGSKIAALYRAEAFISVNDISITSLSNRIKREKERGADKDNIRSGMVEQLKKMNTVQVVDICGGCKHWWIAIGSKRLCLLFSEYKGNAAS